MTLTPLYHMTTPYVLYECKLYTLQTFHVRPICDFGMYTSFELPT